MLEIKKKSKTFALIGVTLLVAGTLSYTLAWVTDSKKAKVTSDEVLISKTDELMISLDNENYYGTIDLSNSNQFKNINLKDFSGDGINLYSAIIDPYTKQAQSTGWQYIRTDVNENINQSQKDLLDSNNENKSYYSFDVYFKSAVPLNVYLYQDSYVHPSTTEMNKLDDDDKIYCTFLKRTAKAKVNLDRTYTVSYIYENEDGVIGTATETTKETFEATLPTIYNKSIYSSDEFMDEKDTNLFNEGTLVSEQTMYSTNYIAGSARVAFIDEAKAESPNTEDDYDYSKIYARVGTDGTLADYAKSRLRLLWAPNPEYRMTKSYNEATDGNTYTFDVVNLVETYFNNQGQKIGKSVTYPGGAKYYYKFTTVDDESTSSFLVSIKNELYYDYLGSRITDVSSQNVVDYLTLKSNIVTTTTNQPDRTGTRTIDEATVSDNRFYSYDGSIASLSSVPTQLFANDLESSSDNLTNCQTISTLEKKLGTDYYEGKVKVIIWVEGSDPEASIALTAGNGAGLNESSGIAKIAYCLSFIGTEIPNSN